MRSAEWRVWREYYRVLDPHVQPNRRHLAEMALAEVIDEYNKPHRVYHSVDHLADVLRELRRWSNRLTEREYLEAFVGLLLHDVVYQIPAGDKSNEFLSAEWVLWFIRKCGLTFDHLNQIKVESAILKTEGHQPFDLMSLAVCWCDLWGFTRGSEASKTYSDKIRAEYLKACTSEQYEAGRRVFLTSYRSPFKTYPGAPISLRIKARLLNRKANKQLDRELAELSIDTIQQP